MRPGYVGLGEDGEARVRGARRRWGGQGTWGFIWNTSRASDLSSFLIVDIVLFFTANELLVDGELLDLTQVS